MGLHATRGGNAKTSSATGEVIPTDAEVLARCVDQYQPRYDVIVPDLPASGLIQVDPALFHDIARAADRDDGH
ncbi:hypothetical protein ACFYMW_25490 [Streptomyces sp. NPDC006692]|uniref:hypothetical protein n=1 Tax=unclassified Streptomyces TaxID=2593676 RepID=UPI003415B7D9